MRVVHRQDVTAVLRVRTPTDVLVVVPSQLPPDTVLALARLVLSSAELAQLHHQIGVMAPPTRVYHR
jgi:hypothetical protein